jgi:hypothetical protein
MHSGVLTYGKEYELSVKYGKAGLRHAPLYHDIHRVALLNGIFPYQISQIWYVEMMSCIDILQLVYSLKSYL